MGIVILLQAFQDGPTFILIIGMIKGFSSMAPIGRKKQCRGGWWEVKNGFTRPALDMLVSSLVGILLYINSMHCPRRKKVSCSSPVYIRVAP